MNYNKKNNLRAFTLIELLVAIAIITMIILWVTSIDYNRLSSKQKLEIFTNSIKSNFENIRNSSLSWKWIWTNLDIPLEWKIEYSSSGWWKIVSSNTLNWTDWLEYEDINFGYDFKITEIKCISLDRVSENVLTSSSTWTVVFNQNDISLWWDCPTNTKILEMQVSWKSYLNTIEINTLNGLIQIKK